MIVPFLNLRWWMFSVLNALCKGAMQAQVHRACCRLVLRAAPLKNCAWYKSGLRAAVEKEQGTSHHGEYQPHTKQTRGSPRRVRPDRARAGSAFPRWTLLLQRQKWCSPLRASRPANQGCQEGFRLCQGHMQCRGALFLLLYCLVRHLFNQEAGNGASQLCACVEKRCHASPPKLLGTLHRVGETAVFFVECLGFVTPPCHACP